MKTYLSFTAEDFAQDTDFLKWVKYPDQYPVVERFWTQWLAENPHKKEEVAEARLLILAIVNEKQEWPEDGLRKKVWERIQETNQDLIEEGSFVVPLWQRWYTRAAVIFLIAGAGWLAWKRPGLEPALRPFVEEMPSAMALQKQVNDSDVPKNIVLDDGTVITLQPRSELQYPENFGKDLREVFLTGEGFFDVVKDPARPFLVHTQDIVTRVLGTTFTIRNYNEGNNVLVQVMTGKVSVFKQQENKQSLDEMVEGVVLMPNQQVIYERDEMKMTKSLVDNPTILKPMENEFEFVDTPVKEVFASIEEAYGVDIVYDEELLANCYLNASLDEVPLYDKLKLICKGINATYEVMDTHIIIYGKGCSDH